MHPACERQIIKNLAFQNLIWLFPQRNFVNVLSFTELPIEELNVAEEASKVMR